MHIGMAGAGLSSAVVARELAEAGHRVTILEQRDHIGGNCHTERDAETGVLVHVYGPHIFHTDDEEVWSYVNKFTTFRPYVNRVKAITGGRVFSLPINLLTINQFYNRTFSPAEAREHIHAIARNDIETPANFEEQALKFIGEDLYRAFFYGYTKKQWGCEPVDIPASILKRLPVRFNYDDNYFYHKYQGMPESGYTSMIENILKHRNISVHVGERFTKEKKSGEYDHVFYSGSIDEYYKYCFGKLNYRTLFFERYVLDGDFQGCAVMNYCDNSRSYTRITEHKHFSPWETHEKSVIFHEYSREHQRGDIPFYPVHTTSADTKLEAYQTAAAAEPDVTFIGRLGTYRYMDMDVCIRMALDTVRTWISKHSKY